MFGFQKYIRSLAKLILSPQGRQQKLRLGINPFDNAEPCYPHDNIVGSHLCDDWIKFILPNVCHKLVSIWGLIQQIYWLTIACRVYQFAPSTSILRQFVSILLISSSSLNWWSSKEGLETLCSCSVFSFANSQYLSTHLWSCPSMS